MVTEYLLKVKKHWKNIIFWNPQNKIIILLKMKKMHNSIPSNTNHYQIKIQSWLFLCKEDSDHTHSNLFKITAPKSIRCKGNKKTKHCINDKENIYRLRVRTVGFCLIL